VSGEARATRVAVLDYEMSNLRSAAKALERLGADVRIARAPDEAEGADAIVLPGDGHFGEAMRRLRASGLDRLVVDAADAGTPVLGICIGLQVLFEASEEAPGVAGLGLLAGEVRRVRTLRKLPHIGWARTRWVAGSPFAPAGAEGIYYYLHTYACEPRPPAEVLAETDLGAPVCAATGAGATAGLQFHPEKSSAGGLALLERWLAHVGAGVAA
jgi:imidazole glycerol-phosphate synthase subunit HisH